MTIPACSHQRPERHARCGVRDDGVPVLHVEPLRARLRQLRVVLQELEQDDDDPRPETQHRGHEQKQKRKFGQKGRLTKEKKRERGLLITGDISGEEFFYYSFKLIPKNRRRVKLQALQF